MFKPNQTLTEASQFLGVSVDSLEKDNQGSLIPGATIKGRPIERPLRPLEGTRGLASAVVEEVGSVLFIKQSYGQNIPIRMTIPELAERTAAFDAFDDRGDGTWRLNRTISIEGDIRLDVTSDSGVKRLELRSDPNDIAALTFDESAVL